MVVLSAFLEAFLDSQPRECQSQVLDQEMEAFKGKRSHPESLGQIEQSCWNSNPGPSGALLYSSRCDLALGH